ncbi:MAG TPA: pectate lyase [Ohtaekwangia sp.]|nr:pectate lyase [Ohtaekwangia sp.]
MKVKLIFLLLLGAFTTQAQDRSLAFPGADGFGKYTTGGRGGKVYTVTNLNDDGPGSLRDAIQKKGPRIVVFAVSGNIALKSPLPINNNDITIAGQSAPGDGICLMNYTVRISADNVIIRFLRFRLGDETKQEADALSGNGRNSNIMIDHCSVSWSTDECASFYRNKNFTMQWCIISESLNQSVHTKGEHGYGGIWGGEGASFHHNLLAHHTSRLPRFSGSSTTPNSEAELVDFRNNVIYNWGGNSTYGGEKGKYNVVNNYYKPGPATKSNNPWLLNPSAPYGKFFVQGNCLVGNEKVSKNNWDGGVKAADPDSAKSVMPFPAEPIDEQSAQKAFALVLEKAGASLARDPVDARIAREVRTGTASSGKNKDGIIDSQNDVGGWPALKSAPPLKDSDADGMPDEWEVRQKLNAHDAADANGRSISGEYDNVEVYLNDLVKKIM